MKEKIMKLIDVKSLVTLSVIGVFEFLVIYTTVTGKDVSDQMFLLFSNAVTMILTFFFTKKLSKDNESI